MEVKQAEKMLSKYATERDQLREEIVVTLKNDDRVLAAWITGSIGRSKEDAISDIDLTAVLTDESARILCDRPFQRGGQIPPERLKFFGSFGRPAIINETHNNAPPGGTFTFIQYEKTALIVDWILVPQSKAERPQDALLLFDKAGIPLQSTPEPLDTAERARIASEKTTFFWMMASVLVKYIYRQDTLLFNSWLDELHWLVYDIEGLIAGEEPFFDPKQRLPLALTAEEQKEALQGVCRRMGALEPAIVEMGGYIQGKSISAVEKRLALT